MKKLHLLLIDAGISTEIIEIAFSSILNVQIEKLYRIIGKQMETGDELGGIMRKRLESGKLLTIDMVGKSIQNRLGIADKDVYLLGYITIELFEKLKSMENIDLGEIWYFKQNDSAQFMNDFIESCKSQGLLNKYGNEMIERWQSAYNEKIKQYTKIQKESNSDSWKIIEIDFKSHSDIRYLKQQIKLQLQE